MKISRAWLQKYFDVPLPSNEALYDALTFHVFEIDGIESIKSQSENGVPDVLIDVKVTANRGHDCLSHRGIAKELSAILQLPLKADPLHEVPVLEPKNNAVHITIADAAACPRFTAALITGVKVGPSPQWLRDALEAIGQRSINNVVDATNYVMFDVGQPLHAFDAGKLSATQASGAAEGAPTYSLNVRTARAGETMVGLDDKSYTLTTDMLVIADQNAGDVPVSIAGIKGGKPTGIDESTTSIILESANWNGVMIRKTSHGLKLRTDASARFEQVISPELAPYGLVAVIELVQRIAGGELVGCADVYPSPVSTETVAVSTPRINAILGSTLTDSEVAETCKRLDFAFVQNGDTCTVTPPFERLDLVIPEDLIEEVGRIIGYDTIPNVPLPTPTSPPAVNQNFYAQEKVREQLLAAGYSEVFTSAFVDKGERIIANKIDGGRAYLRSNLTDGLAEALKKNIPNKDVLALKEIKLFEIGTIWHTDREEIVVATIGEKEPPVQKPLIQESASSYEDLPLSTTLRYQTFSRYPFIVRDIALWVPAGTDPTTIVEMIRSDAGSLLVTIRLFDRFEKADKLSLAFRLIFQSAEKTLTDIEVNAIMETISRVLEDKGFEIR